MNKEMINSFIRSLQILTEYNLSYLAGGEVIDSISEDDEIITDEMIYPGTGDFVVWDKRCLTGTYGVAESGLIAPVKVKNPASHGINYSQKPIERLVSTAVLMKRYVWMTDLFINWLHRDTPSPLRFFGDFENINACYAEEKNELAQDQWLAMYWLLHFGFSMDDRVNEVIAIVEKSEIENSFAAYVEDAINFFKHTDANFNYVITNNNGESSEDLFIKRRSYLVYTTQLYRYASGDNFKKWWLCFSMYPHFEENLILKIRWLKNNLKKFDRWNELDKVRSEIGELPFLSYISACNPNTTDKEHFANQFLEELSVHNYNKTDLQKSFIQIMLYDLRCLDLETDAYLKACEYYFEGDFQSEEYIEILKSKNQNTESLDVSNEASNELQKLLNKDAEIEDLLDSNQFMPFVIELSNLAERYKSAFDVAVSSLKEDSHKLKVFCAYWFQPSSFSAESIFTILKNLFISDTVLKKLIFHQETTQVIATDDERLKIIDLVFTSKENEYQSKFTYEKTLEAAAMLIVYKSYYESIFEYLINIITAEDAVYSVETKAIVFKKIFGEDSYEDFSAQSNYSAVQVEKTFDIGFQAIFETASPLLLNAVGSALHKWNEPNLKSWLAKRYNDKVWLNQFDALENKFKGIKKQFVALVKEKKASL
ncbi:hypothetical protein [Mesonia aestuariivivens]|uniref:Uncharacterized protein n=1 Tax=Mesonia aestuariivivens TaxID=2796128 RepID=A0ABS6VYA7_9FLAO|nr:hypothetical protein [Mesonia aestuariivivens]MBW2960570.1 hypothetical protein [Mesonia aestuariivivens]